MDPYLQIQRLVYAIPWKCCYSSLVGLVVIVVVVAICLCFPRCVQEAIDRAYVVGNHFREGEEVGVEAVLGADLEPGFGRGGERICGGGG